MNSLVVKRPLWYSGGILPRSREFHDEQSRLPTYELNGHELDEIIDEKLTNSAFVWEKLSSFLGFCHVSSLKATLLTWNEHKIRFARIPSNTPGHDNAIRKIAGNDQGAGLARRGGRPLAACSAACGGESGRARRGGRPRAVCRGEARPRAGSRGGKAACLRRVGRPHAAGRQASRGGEAGR
jgi:hypothetical protein